MDCGHTVLDCRHSVSGLSDIYEASPQFPVVMDGGKMNVFELKARWFNRTQDEIIQIELVP